ncbi:type I methionyl aminopeptidase [Candidatus Microgenomates bacterium]|nr:type I methionyl aminopeptidase [Candidatus Microgenomates bacterium]
MINIKTPTEIAIMKEAGQKLAKVRQKVVEQVRSGVTFAELDKIATAEIEKEGGTPAFRRVRDYKWATCINKNDGLLHGIPGEQVVEPGDKISIDVGIFYRGFNSDAAISVAVPPVDLEVERFINTGKKTLELAIKQARVGNRVGHISRAIQQNLEKAGYSPVHEFCGHGVGKSLHEDPMVPCLLSGEIEETPLLKPGMVIAIEVIYTQGKADLIIGSDGWTVGTKDGKMGGLFEETVAILDSGPVILTKFDASRNI